LDAIVEKRDMSLAGVHADSLHLAFFKSQSLF